MNPAAALRARHPVLFAIMLVLTACVAQAFLLCTPAFIGLMAHDWHYSETQQGFTVTAEIGSATVGTLLVSFVLARRSVRLVVLTGLLCVMGANLVMASGLSAHDAVLARAVSGFGCGLISGVGIRFLALGPHAARMLGFLTMTQSVFAMTMMSFVLPALGRAGLAFQLYAAMAVVCLPLLLFLGQREPIVSENTASRGTVHRGGAYMVLFSMFAIYVAIGIVWTFVENLGLKSGIAPQVISSLLGTATMVALTACVVMPWLISKGWGPGGGGAALLVCAVAVSLLALALPMTTPLYATGIMAFLIGNTGASIAQYASLPKFDPEGRLISLSTGFIGMGYAVGSATGGHLIETTTLAQTFLVGAAFCVIAALSFVGAHLLRRPQAGTPPLAQDVQAI